MNPHLMLWFLMTTFAFSLFCSKLIVCTQTQHLLFLFPLFTLPLKCSAAPQERHFLHLLLTQENPCSRPLHPTGNYFPTPQNKRINIRLKGRCPIQDYFICYCLIYFYILQLLHFGLDICTNSDVLNVLILNMIPNYQI